MPIAKGEALPDASFVTMTAEGPTQLSSADVFNGRKVVLFAVPGAFTPTCHAKHLPGFMAKIEEIKAKGVDTIACISVNDAFVLDAWARQTGASDQIMFLADGNADFTRKVGLEMDASGFGMGTRSQRYAMIVDDAKVLELFVEPAAGQAEVTSADAVLAAL